MSKAKMNKFSKALQAHLASEKKHDFETMLEWEIACNTNNQRGKVYNQEELKDLYNRMGQHQGASKCTHTSNHNGDEFKYIVIKRSRRGGYMPDVKQEHKDCTGNQIIDEVNCWEKYANNEEVADLLCPILKYFKSKSDKVTSTSEKMQDNNIIISQKAIATGDASEMCDLAEDMNYEEGYYTDEDAYTRYDKLKNLSDMMGWRDVLYNVGNSGVIFDYANNCYKAVFIDYAL